MSAVIWEQEERKELTIMMDNKEDAEMVAEILRNKKLEIVWSEAWTHHLYPFAVRIEYSDSQSLR